MLRLQGRGGAAGAAVVVYGYSREKIDGGENRQAEFRNRPAHRQFQGGDLDLP